jgi:hypothetical protein
MQALLASRDRSRFAEQWECRLGHDPPGLAPDQGMRGPGILRLRQPTCGGARDDQLLVRPNGEGLRVSV